MITITVILIFAIIYSCWKLVFQSEQYEFTTQEVEELSTSYLKIVGDSIEIPSFEIALKLSENAEEKLKKDKETIIVKAIFYGNPIENLPEKYRHLNDEIIGGLMLLTHSIELTDSRIVKFENLKFSKKLYPLLEDKDIRLLINVVSGRKSTDLNLLGCHSLQGRISKIKNKRFIIKGRLLHSDKKGE